jgi:hypothetical protein
LSGITRALLIAYVRLSVTHIVRWLWRLPSPQHPAGHLASAADAEDLEFRGVPPPVEKIVVPSLSTVVVFLPEPLCLVFLLMGDAAMPHDVAIADADPTGTSLDVRQCHFCIAPDLVSYDRVYVLQVGFGLIRPRHSHQAPSPSFLMAGFQLTG